MKSCFVCCLISRIVFTDAINNPVFSGAGSVIKKAFDQPKNVEFKGDQHDEKLALLVVNLVSQQACKRVHSFAGKVDLVTETDKECEKLIFGRLKEAFPDHQFIGEEESSAQGFTASLTDAPTWMVDPVDGEVAETALHRRPS